MRFLISMWMCLLLLINACEKTNGQTPASTTVGSDPCSNYNTIDDHWRDIRQESYRYYSYDDTLVEWNGWYRLYLNGESAQMSEWCVSSTGCGGQTGLYLNGSHPRLEDGVVTREVLGNHIWHYGQCGNYRSNPIQVKACPGDYYVYKLVTPDVSLNMPSYCAVVFNSISDDPCYDYEPLDRPWRVTTESGLYICDDSLSWSGWYRLYHYGMNIQMAENCVNQFSCNADMSLSLSGSHPMIEDGVVTREVCWGDYGNGCCSLKSKPIRVKACPGNYYVYELVKPVDWWCGGYCTDISTISQTDPTTTPAVLTGSNITMSDPCFSYNILDDYWRSTLNYWYMYGHINDHDDTRVHWDSWYRLFINGSSAQIPEWCVSYMSCGGYTSLWLGGSHPQIEDGVVSLEVYGSVYDQCNRYTSNPIQVKACPGNYYVYKLIRPNVAMPLPAYCAVPFSTPSVDPCDSYTSLDESWRSIDNSYYSNYNYYYNYYMCDYNVNWNGWYRLFLNGQSAQMPESCVSEGMCGTYNPLTLRDPHPQLEDGIVTRHVCVSGWNGCCGYETHPIQVKACPGDFYVYEFVRPIFCGAYCAAVTDPCPALNCTEDELCGENNGVYGCFCKENRTTTEPESFDLSETCESSSGSLSLSRCQLFEAGFSANVLHLNDPRCRGTIRNGRVEFHFDNNDHICGTTLVANGTHFIYENFVLGGQEAMFSPISREGILKLSFSCVYPQTQQLSMNMEINPLESVVHRTLPVGQGTYQVRMIPYQDSEFLQPFTGSVSVELNQQLFVEVRVDGVDSHQFSTVIDSCWATPENNPDHSMRWDLITGECPNPHDHTVELLQNGVSTSSRFSFRMFIFTTNSSKVYLHCAVHLCLLSINSCTAPCSSGYHRRARRSLDFHDGSSISVGPFVWSNGTTDMRVADQARASVASCLFSSPMVLLVSLMSVLTFLK